MSSGDASKHVHKVIIVGAGGVGKSALTLRFMYNEFIENYEPTKADSYRRNLDLGNETVHIDILDTAGQEEFAVIRDNYFRSGDGFLCVFSLTLEESFHELEEFRESILRVKEIEENDPVSLNKIPIILVGNKKDLTEYRKVSEEDAKAKATTWAVDYIETSAKKKENVDEVFIAIARKINAIKSANSKSHDVHRTKKKKGKKLKCNIL